jgi:hypothetical protein
MRAWLLSIFVLAAPALAEAPATIVVAPAGECAGEERDLARPALPKPPARDAAGPVGIANDPTPTPAGVVHLTPTNVASNAPLAEAPLPALSAFGGPGACDNPGSGCALEKIIEDPDPGTGCGFPGSGCP